MKKGGIIWSAVLGGFALAAVLVLAFAKVDTHTTTSNYCMSCHYHDEADRLWKQSSHHLNKSGVVTDCAACHLPPRKTGSTATT